MPRAFISHRTCDRPFVETELLPLLQHFGIDTWYCKLDIAAGDVWEKEIREGLESCDWFIIVLSPRAESTQSPWIHAEVSFAFDQREGRIIPVLLEPVATVRVHLRLATLQHVDFSTPERTTARLQLLECFGVRVTEVDLPTLNGKTSSPSPLPLANPGRITIPPVQIAMPEIRISRSDPIQISPPLPKEVLRREGLLAGLTDVMVQIEEDRHVSLTPGKQSLEQAKELWQRLHDDLDSHPVRLPEPDRQTIEHVLDQNPDSEYATAHEFLRRIPPREAEAYFHRVRNVARARREFERGQSLYESFRVKILTRLQEMRSTTEEALRQLQQQDQTVLLQGFLEARHSMEQFEEKWADLLQVMIQRRYLGTLPEREQVRRKMVQLLDERAWKQALAEGTESAYLDYLQAFATPTHQNEAQAALARIDQEHAWHQTRRLGTVDALRTFLLNFPESVHGPEAQEQLRHLAEAEDQRFRQFVSEAWQHAKQTATVESYRTFLLEYPNSDEAEEARQLLVRQEKKSWKRVKQSEGSAVVEALQAYLQQFPDGPMEGQARQRLTDCLRENVRAKPTSGSLRRRYLEVRTEKGRRQDVQENKDTKEWLDSMIGLISVAFSFWPATYTYYWIVGYELHDILAVLVAFFVFAGVWIGAVSVLFTLMLTVLIVIYRELDTNPEKVEEKVAELGPLPFWDSYILSLKSLRKKYLGDEPLDTPTPTSVT